MAVVAARHEQPLLLAVRPSGGGAAAAFHASVAQLEASVAQEQANLEAAMCGAVGLGAGGRRRFR